MKLANKVTLILLALVIGSLSAINTQAGEGEKKSGCQAQFSEFDLDGDGFIVEQEWSEGHAKRMQAMADEGRKMKHDGEIPTHASLDLNDDGKIDAEEFAAHKKEHMHEHKHDGKGKHHAKDEDKSKSKD